MSSSKATCEGLQEKGFCKSQGGALFREAAGCQQAARHRKKRTVRPKRLWNFMAQKVTRPPTDRARRYALRFRVYFRERDSPKWLKGTTENISHTGVLFLSSSPLALETPLDLRLSLELGPRVKDPAEIRCKGAVVRLEPSKV